MKEPGFAKEYYNMAWAMIAHSVSSLEQQRIEDTIALIPKDCSSILDVGCGDGRLTNLLASRYKKVVGLDNSEEALQAVSAEKVLGNIDSLPFPDKSFDLVLCTEVLEHLPFKVYPKALGELERVAKKYIIISVPNNENLKKSSITCPYCGCVFNPNRHVRLFNKKDLEKLFHHFESRVLQECAPVKIYPAFLLKIAKFMGLVPNISFPLSAVCPQCGYSSRLSEEAKFELQNLVRGEFKRPPLRRLAKKIILTKKKGQWLLALYQRK